jgi:choline dehydrogenase-like flavoprotein
MPVAVIGSGLTALACTNALLRRGAAVTVLDAGMTLDAPTAKAVERLRSLSTGDWPVADAQWVTRNPSLENGWVPQKLAFGSEYVFARKHKAVPMEGNHHASPTLALGGFGNVWGAAVLPAAPEDTAAWPIQPKDLAPSYGAVFDWLPLSGEEDRLANVFPLFSRKCVPLQRSADAAMLLRDLDAVGPDTLIHGRARMAVAAPNCRYCGHCLSGCVYQALFNPAHAFQRLQREARIDYQPGWVLKTVTEESSKVRVTVRRLDSAERDDFIFDRVFIATGAINSTRVVLESLGLYGCPVVFREAQRFVTPVLRVSGAPVAWPKTNTLASVFIEMRVSGLGDNWMHVQLSGMNEFIAHKLRRIHGRWTRRFTDPVERRLMVGLCALHSDHSAGLRAVLLPGVNGQEARIRLDEIGQSRARRARRRAVSTLARVAPRFRSIIAAPAVLPIPTGASNHIGGTLPMRWKPFGPLESDLLGRPAGWQRVHVVDSSVLPTIPATTTALPSMANADRIARTCALD